MEILLVEDSDLPRYVIKTNLEMLGHHVTALKNGQDCLNYYKRGYDVILLDIGLPDLSGYEVARYIRLHEEKRNIIIAISNDGDKIREQCVRAGINAAYKKPLDFETLNRILKCKMRKIA